MTSPQQPNPWARPAAASDQSTGENPYGAYPQAYSQAPGGSIPGGQIPPPPPRGTTTYTQPQPVFDPNNTDAYPSYAFPTAITPTAAQAAPPTSSRSLKIGIGIAAGVIVLALVAGIALIALDADDSPAPAMAEPTTTSSPLTFERDTSGELPPLPNLDLNGVDLDALIPDVMGGISAVDGETVMVGNIRVEITPETQVVGLTEAVTSRDLKVGDVITVRGTRNDNSTVVAREVVVLFSVPRR